jgi:hypothetical protein
MNTTAAVSAAVIAVVVTLLIVCVWYVTAGWTAFRWASGADTPQWTAVGAADVSGLRFKNAVFTVGRLDGKTFSFDVTPQLNAMACAYKGGTANPTTLKLTGPLNAFSFTIQGFNDSATVSDPGAYPWCGAQGCAGALLSGSVRTL